MEHYKDIFKRAIEEVERNSSIRQLKRKLIREKALKDHKKLIKK